MERYNKYLVLKTADIEKYLSESEQAKLAFIASVIHFGRLNDGKQDQQYTCVAADWPMYEQVWGMVEAFVDGKPNEIEQLQARVAELENRAKGDQITLVQSEARITELEAENARLKEVKGTQSYRNSLFFRTESERDELRQQLLLAQADSKLLRDALEDADTVLKSLLQNFTATARYRRIAQALALPQRHLSARCVRSGECEGGDEMSDYFCLGSDYDCLHIERLKNQLAMSDASLSEATTSIVEMRNQISELTRQRDLAVEALDKIAITEWHDAALDPQRAIRISKQALSTIKESEGK